MQNLDEDESVIMAKRWSVAPQVTPSLGRGSKTTNKKLIIDYERDKVIMFIADTRNCRVLRWVMGEHEGTLASDFKCPDRGKGKGNFEVPFSRFPELFRARSRLYRSQILQVNTRWKALVEIYTMHSFAPFWNP